MASIENETLILTKTDMERIRNVGLASRGTSREKQEHQRSAFEATIDEYIEKRKAENWQ